MDIRSLISKLDSIQALNEALTLDQVTAAVGQEKNEQKRAAILMQMAQKENLPGLYDPVSGYFVSATPDRDPMTQQERPRISATASKNSDQALAQLGLVPQNAKTSTGLGRMFRGDQKGQYDLDTKQTSRDARTQQLIADLVGKAGPLLDKLEKKYAAPTTESINYTSGIARALAESIGYNLIEAEAPVNNQTSGYADTTGAAPTAGEEDPDLKALQAIMMQLSDISDPKVEPIKDRYAKLLTAMDTAKKAAADKAEKDKQAADTKTAQAEADKLTAEGLKKKIERLKELLAKLKTKKEGNKPGQSATPAPGAVAGGAAGAANPLKNDPISANALARKDGPIAKESLSESEIIARLRQQLENIENRGANDEQVDEFIGSAIRGLGALGKAVKTGFTGAPVATGKLTKSGAPQMTSQGSQKFAKALAARPGLERGAYGLGKAVKANPGKTALGTAVAGTALGYGLSDKNNPNQDVTPVPPGPKPPGPAPAPTPTPGTEPTPQEPGDDADMQEIGQLMSDIGQYTNPQESPADAVDAATKALADAQAQLKNLGYTP
jgi:hypothetical protein